MKAISILQPWASLVVHGHKRIETRSWNTKYRGELLIHASGKKVSPKMELTDAFAANYGKLQLFDEIPSMFNLPLGAIIGKVNLVGTFSINGINYNSCGGDGKGNEWSMSHQELAFGDYSPNRFGWLLSDPIVFDEPIPCKGQLGIWNFDTRSLLNSGISHVQFTHDQDPSIEEVLAINAMYEKAKYIKV